MKITAIIGAGFGDEGKGLTTDYIVGNSENKSRLNIRFNGGSQAGHTVRLSSGTKYIFKSLGSGTLRNTYDIYTPTYFTEDFIIEPVSLLREKLYLSDVLNITNIKVYANKNCRISTIYDLVLNQQREFKRTNRHGSCGYGIYETIKRNESVDFKLSDLYEGKEHIRNKLLNIVEYFKNEMYNLGYTENEILNIINIDSTLENGLDLMIELKSSIICIKDSKSFLSSYDELIFEGAQGLMLDMDNIEYMPHLTPSHTGLTNVVKELDGVVKESDTLDVIYITRSYLTRHGNGRLDNEVVKSELGDLVGDTTNIENQFQGKLRYAKLNLECLIETINQDFEKSRVLRCKSTKNLMITHLDQTDGMLKTMDGDISVNNFGSRKDCDYHYIYTCSGETAESIKLE